MSRKRSRYEAALVEREADEEEESSEEEGSGDGTDEQEAAATAADAATAQQKKLQLALTKGKGLVCHVCGKSGHKAGFVGAVYMDCPNKPCYLCKQPGHTTATCPHNLAVGGSSGDAAAAGSSDGDSSGGRANSLVHRLLHREHSGRQVRGPLAALKSPRWQVDAAILKLHSRRVCCLAVPDNSDSHVLSGDKKGGIAIWNFMQVHDRTLYTNIHRALVNTLRPSLWLTGGYDVAAASSDGTVKIFDIETGSSQQLADINPGGWVQGCKWNMFYGMDTSQDLHVVFAGDSEGRVHLLDPRTQEPVNILQLHKAGSKVTSLSMNPAGGSRVILTAGNDHTAKLHDVRKLTSINSAAAAGGGSSQPPTPPTPPPRPAAAAAAAEAGGDANSGRGGRGGRGRGRGRGKAAAAAEPEAAAAAETAVSGRGRGRGRGRGSSGASAAAAAAAGGGSGSGGRGKNSAVARAAAAAAAAEVAVLKHGRVVNAAVFSPSGRKILTTCQDNRLRVWDNLLACGGPPSREIVHSHDFNRYLTPFKAEWFPTDPSESLILCGRYISEDFGGVALHPVDILDASSGRLLAALVDGHLETITPVNLPHPRLDIIISGSSRSLYKWVPQQDDDEDDDPLTQGLGRRGSAAAAMAAAVAAAAAAGGGARRAGVSDSFMCFDADPQGGGSKGGGKGAAASKTKAKTKAASTKAAGSGSKAAAAGRKRGKREKGDDSDDDNAADSDSD